MRGLVCGVCMESGARNYNVPFPSQMTDNDFPGFTNQRDNATIIYTENQPFIILNATSGPIGNIINVGGYHFSANTNTNIFFNNILVGQVGHIGTGFNQTITVPDLHLGNYTVTATDQTNPFLSASANYIIASPTLILNSTNGNVGKTVSISGSGYNKNSQLYFNFSPPYLLSGNLTPKTNPLPPVLTNNTGGFSGVKIIIPSGIAGKHNVNVTDSYLNNGSSVYNVTSSLQATPITIFSSGSFFNIIGNGFTASHTITFTFNGVTLSPSFGGATSSNSTGSFATQAYKIPSLPSGSYILNSTDGSHKAQTNVLVVPSLANNNFIISPTSGYIGSTLNMSGNKFHSSSNMTFKFDGTILNTVPAVVTTNGTGGFKGVQTIIPLATIGNHIITANDTQGTLLTQNFFVNFSPVTNRISASISGNTITVTPTITFIPPPNNITATAESLFVNNALIQSQSFKIPINGNVPTNMSSLQATLTTASNVFMNVTLTDGKNTVVFKSNTLNFLVSPDAVTDLNAINITTNSVQLSWSQPNLRGNTLLGYQINYTTPFGSPLTIITNNTNSRLTSFTVTGLANATNYSFRVGLWTPLFKNMGGNILGVTTLTKFFNSNVTLGGLNLNSSTINAVNPVSIPIYYQRSDINGSTTLLKVIYPSYYNLNCNISYKFAQTNKNYTNLSRASIANNQVDSVFQFTNSSNEVITTSCTDINTGTNAKYIITQSNFPMIQQVKDFRSGKFGTAGQFGAIDIIALVAVIIGMIGFNRVNEAAGVIFTIIFIGVLAFFQIITWPTVFAAALAVIVLIAVTSHRKIPSI